MTIGRTLRAFPIIAVAFGCATMAVKKDLVVDRAKFDLSCESINVVELGGDAFGATGCGKKASYIVDCKNNEAHSCTAILNSDERNANE
jgi:hypothetical protein